MRRVVIIGGGYAGLHAFRSLRRELGSKLADGDVEVVLVSREPYHTFHGWTGEVLAGVLPVESTLTPLSPLLGDSFLQGDVVSVDLTAQTLEIIVSGRRQRIEYEHLMFANGSKDPLEKLPGVAEHGWCLKDSRDMQRLVAHLADRSSAGRMPRNIVIIGGGLAGIETASALAERYRAADEHRANIHLVSGNRVLDQLRPSFSHIADHAARALSEGGVLVHEHQRVTFVGADHVSLASGDRLDSDLTIVTAGLSHAALAGSEHLVRTFTGQLATDESLRARGHNNIWAAGDAASVRRPGTGEACPTNALWAMKQGDCVGRNIARALQNKSPKSFSFKGLGQTAGLGDGKAITELLGIQFTGPIASLIRTFFFAWYMPSRRCGFQLAAYLLFLRREPVTRRRRAPLKWTEAAPWTTRSVRRS